MQATASRRGTIAWEVILRTRVRMIAIVIASTTKGVYRYKLPMPRSVDASSLFLGLSEADVRVDLSSTAIRATRSTTK